MQDLSGRSPRHRASIVEIPLEDELALAVDMDVPGRVIADPSEEEESTSPELAHTKCYRTR